MSRYYINYHTGAASEPTDGNLEEAKRFADSGITYTKSDVSIEDEHGNLIERRFWLGVLFNPKDYDDGENADVIQFGDLGHYTPWMPE